MVVCHLKTEVRVIKEVEGVRPSGRRLLILDVSCLIE